MAPHQNLAQAVYKGPRTTTASSSGKSNKTEALITLPNEAGARTLYAEPVRTGRIDQGNSAATSSGSGTAKTYKWSQFGKEHITEFDDDHFKLEGHFESNSSNGHKEYQDRIRAIHFRQQGKQKAEIAEILGRSDRFVAKWWNKDEKEVPRPWGVHEYLSKDLGQETFINGIHGTADDTAKSAATWWRDVEVKRGYAADPAIFEEILHNTEWKSGAARTRDFSTGASHVKYDKDGKMRLQGNQSAGYKQGLSPAFDKVLQKFFAEYGLMDRTSGIIVNWYPDGNATLGSHRHDCWTALFSFGSERILTIDRTPLLCQDGDLVIFGTQRHGVPFMPEISEGRITVPIFFYPDHLQMKKQWQTLTDPEDPRASRELRSLERDFTLAQPAAESALWEDAGRVLALQTLTRAGFPHEAAKSALLNARFDADRAAELLLMSGVTLGAASGEDEIPIEILSEQKSGSAQQKQGQRGGRWAARAAAKKAEQPSSEEEAASCCCSTAVPPPSLSAGSSQGREAVADEEEEDLALALRLQMEEEEGHHRSFGQSGASSSTSRVVGMVGGDDDAAAAAALAIQLEEEERLNAGFSEELLQAQFQEYEDQMTRDSAEEWHGHGDLMMSTLARDTLSLETMDKVTVYSIGHGQMREKDFFELLSLNSVRTLYDFRKTDHRGEVHSPCAHFTTKSLKSICRSRGLKYKHIALGRESAYGILRHVSSDEAQHALVELVWHAKRGRTAFLGFEPDFRRDHRLVIAEELAKHGNKVLHIDDNGATEEHKVGEKFPDFIMKEEERLRKVEKMRQAGELQRPTKSSVDRSSEAIAYQLEKGSQEIDAKAELASASNQMELVAIQNRLARMHRIAEKHGALAHKKLSNTPSWVLEQAQEQQQWIAQKKAEKLQKKTSEDSPDAAAGYPSASSSSSAAAVAAPAGPAQQIEEEEAFVVECKGCSQSFPWKELEEGDGLCNSCCTTVVDILHEAAAEEQREQTEHEDKPSAACSGVSDKIELQAEIEKENRQPEANISDKASDIVQAGASGTATTRSGWRGRRREANQAASQATQS